MTDYLKNEFDFESDELLEVLDEVPLWSAPFGIKLLERVKLRKNIKALDIGFGAGFPLTEIAMRLGPSSKVYGIDPWEAASRRVKKKLKVYGISNVELLNGVCEELPIEANQIDLLTSNNGINNVSDLDKALSECARVAKPGAQFIQTVNLNTTMTEFYETLEKCLLNIGAGNEVETIRAHIYSKRKPLQEFTKRIEQSGFEVTDVSEHKFQYTFMDGTAMLNHYFIQLAFLPDWKNLVHEKQREDIFRSVELELNRIAEQNGSVKLSVPFVVIDSIKR